MRFQSPISGSQTRGILSRVLIFLGVSIPYKRVTNPLCSHLICRIDQVSIPYKRVTNLSIYHTIASYLNVSIPYKRVTNGLLVFAAFFLFWVSIPYKRVTNEKYERRYRTFYGFQSPISGSQTLRVQIINAIPKGFQSPISGSQT